MWIKAMEHDIKEILENDYAGKCDYCGVCCEAISINSKMPDGSVFSKPSGTKCKYLENNKCSVWGDHNLQPQVCRTIQPNNSLCRFDLPRTPEGNKIHKKYLMELDEMTSPTTKHEFEPTANYVNILKVGNWSLLNALFQMAILTKRKNKNTGKNEYCLVSRDRKRVLEWYGSEKPSDERVTKTEKRVQWFKHHK
jgi:hypothetical protein